MVDGLILGVITWLSLIFSFQHLPGKVRSILLAFPLFCDVSATLLCFMFLSSISKSLISVIGSITCGLLVNFTLVLYKNFFNVKNENQKQTE